MSSRTIERFESYRESERDLSAMQTRNEQLGSAARVGANVRTGERRGGESVRTEKMAHRENPTVQYMIEERETLTTRCT